MPTYPVQEADDYTVRLAAKRRFIERLEREASTRPEPTEAEMQAIMQEIDDEREAIYQKNLTLKALEQVSKRLTEVWEKESGRTTYQFGLPDVIISADVTDEITDFKQLSTPSTFGLSGFKRTTVVPEPTEEVLEEELTEVKTKIQRTEAEIKPIQALPKQEWKGG